MWTTKTTTKIQVKNKLSENFRIKSRGSAICCCWLLVATIVGTLFCRIANANLVIQNVTDVKGNNAIKEIRAMYTANQTMPIKLVRGVPLFAEIDFVPRFFPSKSSSIVATVMIPETVRRSRVGGPWIIGWNQERMEVPSRICRLCTNTQQSYTIPITLFLPDDGWCPEGPIPTGWKIEVTMQSSGPYTNSDLTIAMVVDEYAQIEIVNKPDSISCKDVRESIRYTVPPHLIPLAPGPYPPGPPQGPVGSSTTTSSTTVNDHHPSLDHEDINLPPPETGAESPDSSTEGPPASESQLDPSFPPNVIGQPEISEISIHTINRLRWMEKQFAPNLSPSTQRLIKQFTKSHNNSPSNNNNKVNINNNNNNKRSKN